MLNYNSIITFIVFKKWVKWTAGYPDMYTKIHKCFLFKHVCHVFKAAVHSFSSEHNQINVATTFKLY